MFFESDQTELSPQAMATLDKQSQWLQQYNRYSFTIEGHADERGTREYNIALGARRAQSAADSGGTMPPTGSQRTIDSPLSVSRVMPPTTTMAKTIAATANSHVATARGRAIADEAVASESVTIKFI